MCFQVLVLCVGFVEIVHDAHCVFCLSCCFTLVVSCAGHKQQVVFRQFDVHVEILPTGLVVRSFKETVRYVTGVSFYSPFYCKSLSMAMTFLNFFLSLPPFALSSVSVRYMLWFNFILGLNFIFFCFGVW